MRSLGIGLITALVAVALPQPSFAQQAGADVVDVLVDFLLKEKLLELPASAPNAKQVTAPAGANGTTSISSGPSFPELIGLAFDNDLAGFKDGAFTLDLNLFAFRALANPNAEIDQTRYGTRTNSLLRRVGVAVSVGGKGERFDRNGDGQADAALPADGLTDVVTGEVRVRVFGSRDRRDDGNFARFKAVAKDEFTKLVDLTRTFLISHEAQLPRTEPNAAGDRFLDVKKFNDFLARPDIAPEVKAVADAYQAYLRAHEEAVLAIDRRAIWTLVAGGTRHADDFGPDRFHVGLRGVMNRGGWDSTINVDYNRANANLASPAADKVSASYEASRLLFKGTLSDEGVELALAANFERNNNVPDAKHRTIGRASAALALPITPTLSVPFTVSYANHMDLLTDQDVWAGQVGIAWDLSALGKK
jgi:hypothetical protein